MAVDEDIPLLAEIVPHLSPACRELLGDHREEGAVALLVDKDRVNNLPRIRAFGPVFAGDTEIAALTDSLFKTAGLDATVVPWASNRSFLAAALRVYECIHKGASGRTIIGSFSPSSHAFSAIEVTV